MLITKATDGIVRVDKKGKLSQFTNIPGTDLTVIRIPRHGNI